MSPLFGGDPGVYGHRGRAGDRGADDRRKAVHPRNVAAVVLGAGPRVAVIPDVGRVPDVGRIPDVGGVPDVGRIPDVVVRVGHLEGAVRQLRHAALVVLRAGEIRGDVQALVGAVAGRAIYRGPGVDQARALLQHAVSDLAVGVDRWFAARENPALHLVGRQALVVADHERRDTGDDGGGLRRTGHGEEVTAVHVGRVVHRDLLIGGHEAPQMAARSDQVRLHETFEGRTGGGERGEPVIILAGGVIVGHRADRDDVRDISRYAHGLRQRSAIA